MMPYTSGTNPIAGTTLNQTVSQAPIAQAVGEIQKRLCAVDELVDELTHRLAVVLAPEQPQAVSARTDAPPRPQVSALAETLTDVDAHVAHVHARIHDLMARIEL